MKRQPTEHDKISASKATEKRLTSKIYRQLNTKKKKKLKKNTKEYEYFY